MCRHHCWGLLPFAAWNSTRSGGNSRLGPRWRSTHRCRVMAARRCQNAHTTATGQCACSMRDADTDRSSRAASGLQWCAPTTTSCAESEASMRAAAGSVDRCTSRCSTSGYYPGSQRWSRRWTAPRPGSGLAHRCGSATPAPRSRERAAPTRRARSVRLPSGWSCASGRCPCAHGAVMRCGRDSRSHLGSREKTIWFCSEGCKGSSPRTPPASNPRHDPGPTKPPARWPAAAILQALPSGVRGVGGGHVSHIGHAASHSQPRPVPGPDAAV